MVQSRDRTEQERLKRELGEIQRQLNLMRQISVTREESDFHPYHYLAS